MMPQCDFQNSGRCDISPLQALLGSFLQTKLAVGQLTVMYSVQGFSIPTWYVDHNWLRRKLIRRDYIFCYIKLFCLNALNWQTLHWTAGYLGSGILKYRPRCCYCTLILRNQKIVSCTNTVLTSSVSMHGFPLEKSLNRLWTRFVQRHRPFKTSILWKHRISHRNVFF